MIVRQGSRASNVARPSRLRVSAASRRQTFECDANTIGTGTGTVPELAGEDACATIRKRDAFSYFSFASESTCCSPESPT